VPEKPPVANDAPDTPRGRRLRGAIYLGLLVVGIIGAWRGHVMLRGPDEPDRPGMSLLDPGSRRMESSGVDFSSPDALTGDVYALAGLRHTDSDPGGIAPPAGATRRLAFELGDGTRGGRYDTSATMADTAAYYRRVLDDEGFQAVGEKAGSDGRRTLVFVKQQARAIITLRKRPSDANIVEIVVIMKDPLEGPTPAE
jgi:hypothetical protein